MGATHLWRRLDAPGHDACRLDGTTSGWVIAGAVATREGGAAARLDYEVECDRAWRSRRGRVEGWIGDRKVSFDIARSPAGAWTLNGQSVAGLETCVDLDLGFTPATNLLQLRRLALVVGQGADVPVAWLDVYEGELTLLPQRYERRTEATYWYTSPATGYAGTLEVMREGFVLCYPRLWDAEGRAPQGIAGGGKAVSDDDLEAVSRDELVAEIRKLRAGIRAHRDRSGHDLCWHQPALWRLLPEQTDPLPAVPGWPQFLRGCVRYRESLDEQAAEAPRTHQEYDPSRP